jgi:hypothetical protein
VGRCAAGQQCVMKLLMIELPVVKFIGLPILCQHQGVMNGLHNSGKVQTPGWMMLELMCHTLLSLLNTFAVVRSASCKNSTFMGKLVGKCF